MTDRKFVVLEGESKPFCDIIKYDDDSDSFDAADVVAMLNEQNRVAKGIAASALSYSERAGNRITEQNEQIAELQKDSDALLGANNALKCANSMCDEMEQEIAELKEDVMGLQGHIKNYQSVFEERCETIARQANENMRLVDELRKASDKEAQYIATIEHL